MADEIGGGSEMKRLVFAALLALGGCAHAVQLTPRDGGPIGYGSAPASMGDKGTLTVNLNGKTYTGRWVLVRGGSMGFGTAVAGTSVATASMYGMAADANGQAILSAEDGSRLRCQFSYSSWSDAGMGVCQDDAGKTYDMTIG
jgi:hypothetical protein